ncbi:MAG: hypothetical protein ACT6UH_07105 [Hydrogenophaga sp.]|uniref:hypothetical protein n=1 Tax=Hydrogenophaga sp. TaxID=1904254 RepID=UPI0040371948
MDAAEKLAHEFLVEEGRSSICYEPNGTSTYPDFSVEGNVAVEVRRLDQHHLNDGVAEDLQDAAYRVRHRMEKLCEELGEGDGTSWFVCYRFSRPVPPWKVLIPKLKAAMLDFKALNFKTNRLLYEDSHFELEVIAASDRLASFFRLGGMLDKQSGGFVVAEFIQNIERCAVEKAKKRARCPVDYMESWLVLVNTTGMKLDARDRAQLMENIKRPPQWDRVVILRAMDTGEKWFEL